MEYKEHTVHRWRYTDWIPSPIRSISCDPLSTRVAIGREDGDIEIVCSGAKWHSLAWIHGEVGFKLQKIVWCSHINQSRIFGISLKGFLFEVDFASLSLKNVTDCYGGSAWCLTSSKRNATLAVGCEDGSCRIFSYENVDQLQYVRTMPSTGSRVLCISFHPILPSLFMGCGDGTIRCVDENSGRPLFRMTGDILRGVSTQIWSMVVLSDSTVVTGDSRGHVQFWDGQLGVLMATIQQHTAEVLILAVSPDESQVFASGTDSRVTCMRKVSVPPVEPLEKSLAVPADADSAIDATSSSTKEIPSKSPADKQWVHTTAQRPHSHDVFALAIVTDGSGGRLLSGGLDCKLCVYSLESFGQSRPSWVLPVPASGLVASHIRSDCSGWSVVRHRSRLDIWALRGQPAQEHTQFVASTKVEVKKQQQPCQLALRLEVKSSAHLACSAMAWRAPRTPGGSSSLVVAASSGAGFRLWHLIVTDPSVTNTTTLAFTDGAIVGIRKVPVPKVADVRCTAIVLSSDGSRAALASASGSIILLDFSDVTDTGENGVSAEDVCVTVRHVFPHRNNVVALSKAGSNAAKRGVVESGAEQAVVRLALSADGLWLGAVDAGLRGRVYVYDLDRLLLHWSVPRCAAPVTALSFHPSSPSSVVLVLANNSFLLQDVLLRRLCPWSETVPPDAMPTVLRGCPGPLQGLAFVPDSSSAMVLYGQGFFVYVDIDQPVGKNPRVISATASSRGVLPGAVSMSKNGSRGRGFIRKRLRDHPSAVGGEEVVDSTNFTMVHRYRGLVHVSCLPDKQLVMFENPWLSVVAQLPDTLARKRFGT